jgi:hypothetical protein
VPVCRRPAGGDLGRKLAGEASTCGKQVEREEGVHICAGFLLPSFSTPRPFRGVCMRVQGIRIRSSLPTHKKKKKESARSTCHVFVGKDFNLGNKIISDPIKICENSEISHILDFQI